MNTPGTRHITAKEVEVMEGCSVPTSYRKIKEVFENLNKRRFTKVKKVTIKEYCEHYGLELKEFVEQFNEKIKQANIIL